MLLVKISLIRSPLEWTKSLLGQFVLTKSIMNPAFRSLLYCTNFVQYPDAVKILTLAVGGAKLRRDSARVLYRFVTQNLGK